MLSGPPMASDRVQHLYPSICMLLVSSYHANQGLLCNKVSCFVGCMRAIFTMYWSLMPMPILISFGRLDSALAYLFVDIWCRSFWFPTISAELPRSYMILNWTWHSIVMSIQFMLNYLILFIQSIDPTSSSLTPTYSFLYIATFLPCYLHIFLPSMVCISPFPAP
jgi:hypothetical protein